jgi:hypothetical protein
LRRVVHQHRGEALELDPVASKAGIPSNQFEALLNPADQISADVEEHANLAVTAVEQFPVQIVGGEFTRRQQPLQHQAGARAFHEPARAVGIGEWMQNERRQLECLPRRFSIYSA